MGWIETPFMSSLTQVKLGDDPSEKLADVLGKALFFIKQGIDCGGSVMGQFVTKTDWHTMTVCCGDDSIQICGTFC